MRWVSKGEEPVNPMNRVPPSSRLEGGVTLGLNKTQNTETRIRIPAMSNERACASDEP